VSSVVLGGLSQSGMRSAPDGLSTSS
jgi:hypothetical protein